LQITEEIFTFGEYRVLPAQRQLLRGTTTVCLSPKAFDLLLLLVRHNGEILAKSDLMQRLWPNTFVEEANLNVHISAIRKALGESAQHPRYITTIPGRGYRFTGTSASKASPRRFSLRHAWTAMIVVTLSCAVSLRPVTDAVERPQSIAVLPFRTLGPAHVPLGEGMADSLITRFSRLDLTVRPTTAILRYAGSEVDSVAAGRELGVDSVVEGSIQQEGERVRVTVRLIRVRDARPLWGADYEEPFAGIFTVQDAISQRVAETLSLELSTKQRKFLLSRQTNSAAAYRFYTAGRHFWNKRTAQGLRRAIDNFQKAIDEDPAYALPYAGLADVYSMLGDFTGQPGAFHKEAEAAARKALQADDELAEAHASLAYLSMRSWQWDRVESELQRALEINPNYATAHQWYSIFLELSGRADEAIAEATRARELDPLSPIINESLGSRLYFARRYDRALEQLRKAIEIEPSFQGAHESLAIVYIQLGRYDDALRELGRPGLSDDRPNATVVAYAHALAGREREARALLNGLRDGDPVEIARIHAGLGDREGALRWLERASEQHVDHLVFIKVDPSWDGLRAEARFEAVVRRVGL